MRHFVIVALAAGVSFATNACLLPSMDGMSGGSSGLPTSTLPVDARPLRVVPGDTTVSAYVDNAFRIDFAQKTSWEPNGLASTSTGLDVGDLNAPWLSVVTCGYCATKTGHCSAVSEAEAPIPPTMSHHETGARMTLEATWRRKYGADEVRGTERFTVLPTGRMHVSFVVATTAGYTSTKGPLEYARIQLAGVSPWVPYDLPAAAAVWDPMRQNVLVAAPTNRAFSMTTVVDPGTRAVMMKEPDTSPLLGITREFDVMFGTASEATTIAQEILPRSLIADGDGSWGEAGFYDTNTGMYSVSAKPQAGHIVIHLTGRSPAVRIAGWSSSTYTVSALGSAIASSAHPSTVKAVTARDADGALEIALAGVFDGTEKLEIDAR